MSTVSSTSAGGGGVVVVVVVVVGGAPALQGTWVTFQLGKHPHREDTLV